MDEKMYKIPEFYNSNWRDDVPEEKEDEEKEMMKFVIYGGDEKNEREYQSPKKISMEAQDRILKRAKNMRVGVKVASLMPW